MPQVGDEVNIIVTDPQWRRRSTRAKSIVWGGYGVMFMAEGKDYLVKYDLDQMPLQRESAKQILAQVGIGTLVYGTLLRDNRYDTFMRKYGFWKLGDITLIVRVDGVQLFSSTEHSSF
jgi:hypothetical protein